MIGVTARARGFNAAGQGKTPARSSQMMEDHGLAWERVELEDLDAWNEKLARTATSFFQYPYWNEPFRRMRFEPHYLVYRSGSESLSYVCVLAAGAPGFRVGLVRRGPSSLREGEPVPAAALRDLAAWARRRGFVFLRFTDSDGAWLERIEAAGPSERCDAFPLYADLQDELTVPQCEDDGEALKNLSRKAQREIEAAVEAGYECRVTRSPESLAELWPLFARLAERKGFRYRPLASYLDLVRAGGKHDFVRLYAAYLHGKPISAILIVRDRDTAFYMSGALDVEALGDRPSPSCLLHWRAMRESKGLGAKRYHLGTKSGVVYRFKRKFRPIESQPPPPVTLILRPWIYAIWSKLLLQTVFRVWPQIRRAVFR